MLRLPTTSEERSARAVASKLLDTVSRRVAGNARARELLYALKNRSMFGDLRQHDRMLADSVRCEAYWDALQAHVEDGDVVVDLGTGSGVLAFFAASAGASVVHAIEHGPLADAARAVAADNGFDNVVVHRMHSRSFELPARADVLVHEQIGEALFNEHAVENVAELRDRVLRPGGKILPAHLELYVEPVELSEDARVPYAHQQRLHGIDFRALAPYVETQPPSYQFQVVEPFPFGRWLADRAPSVSVDLHVAGPSDLPTHLSIERTATCDGTLDGMVVYFRAAFDEERWITSSPDAPRTSWANPLLRIESTRVRAGDTIRCSLTAADLSTPSSWRWTVTVAPR